MKIYKLNKKELKYENITSKAILLFTLSSIIALACLVNYPTEKATHTAVEKEYVRVEDYDHIKYSKFFNKMKIKNKKSFIYEVKALAERVDIPYQDILGVFNFESGLNPKAKNFNGGAYGLFQLMPKTAEGLGISSNELYSSDEYVQLEWFEKYLNYYGTNNIKSFGDLYTIIYLPSYLGKDDKPIPQFILDSNPMYKSCKNIGEFKLLVEKKYRDLKCESL